MIDVKKNQRWNRVILLYFLIWFLLIENSALAFWQFVGIYECGNVAGTIYFNNGVTPLPINDFTRGCFIELMNTTTNSRVAHFTSDDFGRYTSPQVPQGSYYLKVIFTDEVIGISTAFDINASQVRSVDIIASMEPIN
jgi:hypothetical protein